MEMGDDSRLMYDEIGERMEVVKHDLVNYFPFPDARIAELEAKLEAARQSFNDLWLFTQHTPGCVVWRIEHERCDCGLREVAAATREWQG